MPVTEGADGSDCNSLNPFPGFARVLLLLLLFFFTSLIWRDEIVLHSVHIRFRDAVIIYVSSDVYFCRFALHQRYTQGQAFSEIQDGVHLSPENRHV